MTETIYLFPIVLMAPRENINSASNADPIDRIGTNANEWTPTRKYTATEVEKHSTPDDCWLIVRGKCTTSPLSYPGTRVAT